MDAVANAEPQASTNDFLQGFFSIQCYSTWRDFDDHTPPKNGAQWTLLIAWRGFQDVDVIFRACILKSGNAIDALQGYQYFWYCSGGEYIYRVLI